MATIRYLIWYAPAALFLALGFYYAIINHSWRYIVNMRLLDGHGYVFYTYTMVMFGSYGLFLVWRYGRRGFFLSVILGFTCDIGMTFLNVLPTNAISEVFLWNYGLEPVAWFIVIFGCWRLCRPLKVNLISWWSTGMLLAWLFFMQLVGWIGNPILIYLEPMTIATWIIASYKSVRVLN